jgi:hypothetical protein
VCGEHKRLQPQQNCPYVFVSLLIRVSPQFLVLSLLIFFLFHFLDFGHSHKIKYIFGKKIIGRSI